MLRRLVRLTLLVLPFLLPAPAQAQIRNCSTLSQVNYVRDAVDDLYLWYREVPPLNGARFSSPEAYLEAARYRPLDTSFSYITSAAETEAFYGESAYVGFGFGSAAAGDALVITQVFPGSPADDAGMQRGDRIVLIDNHSVSTLLETGGLDAALGASEPGLSRRFAFSRGTAAMTAFLTKRIVTIPTVSLTRVYDVAGRRVGYIFFRNFVTPSFAALDAAFAELRAAGVTELVLDLRYNGGGLVSVARHLADLIGGRLTEGQVFAEYSHNDRHLELNETLRFGAAANALNLSRVVMITTRSSASASELVANALRPFMPVVLIGDRTYGKPVGQYVFEFCEKVLALVSFSLTNANGEADYFDGLAPTCRAGDDLEHQLGDPAEASLQEALVYLDTGGCSSGLRALRQRPEGRPRPAVSGWQLLVGAR
ncbi:MAG: S41 family peptidase [Vicinamibacterales bacterium]